ncbi:MAG: hypothetical protein NT027_01595 [Proteobacteria bacterium]|nr:hypothetical protein [Pseudomonadota bacterium]
MVHELNEASSPDLVACYDGRSALKFVTLPNSIRANEESNIRVDAFALDGVKFSVHDGGRQRVNSYRLSRQNIEEYSSDSAKSVKLKRSNLCMNRSNSGVPYVILQECQNSQQLVALRIIKGDRDSELLKDDVSQKCFERLSLDPISKYGQVVNTENYFYYAPEIVLNKCDPANLLQQFRTERNGQNVTLKIDSELCLGTSKESIEEHAPITVTTCKDFYTGVEKAAIWQLLNIDLQIKDRAVDFTQRFNGRAFKENEPIDFEDFLDQGEAELLVTGAAKSRSWGDNDTTRLTEVPYRFSPVDTLMFWHEELDPFKRMRNLSGAAVVAVEAGEWLSYNVDLTPGKYKLNVRLKRSNPEPGVVVVSLPGNSGNQMISTPAGPIGWTVVSSPNFELKSRIVGNVRVDFQAPKSAGGIFDYFWFEKLTP